MKITKSITSAKTIKAADVGDRDDPRLEQAETLQDRIADDFDYILAGLDRMQRDGQLDEAIDIMQRLSETLDTAIVKIGEQFDATSAEEV